MKVKKVLSVRRYKAGYEVREEVSDFGGDGFIMENAYTPDGYFIGDSKQGYWLCNKRGIVPELAFPKNTVCCIGFCEKEQKWYGWSHLAIYGFGVGDSVKEGDFAYTPNDPEKMLQDLKEQYSENYYENVKFDVHQNKVVVTYDGFAEVLKEALPDVEGSIIDMIPPMQSESYPLGRGEWTANTLDDARLMAIDFADGVG